MATSKYDADVIIIGSGITGALAAYKLALQGVNVLIIEAGDKSKEILKDVDYAEVRKKAVENFAVSKDKFPGTPYTLGATAANKNAPSPDVQDFNLHNPDPNKKPPLYYIQTGPDLFKSQYLRMSGGSTWSWRGNCPRFLPSDFKLDKTFQLKTKFPDVEDWPISYDDLESFYCEAEKEMGISGNHEEFNGLNGAYRSKKFPMENIVQAYGDIEVKKRLKGLKVYGKEIIVTSTPQARNSRRYDGRSACQGNHSCIPVCPTGAKYDAGVHIRKAIAAGAKIIDKAVVTKLHFDSVSKMITGVEYRAWDDTKQTIKTAKIIVLAAHAVETPRLLLLSEVPNSSDMIGRNLMDHIGGEGAALMPFKVYPFRGPQSTSGIENFRDGDFRKEKCAFRFTVGNDGWGRGLTPLQLLDKIMFEERLFGHELNKKLDDIITRQLRFSYSTEQLPNRESRVTLSSLKDEMGMPKPRIATKLDDYSKEGIRYAQSIIKKLFTRLGAAQDSWEFSDIDANVYSGSGHIMGTCKMGANAKTSVVDAQCRTHDHKNLFIIDGSVFTTGGTANPTLTNAAVSLFSVPFIKAQLKK
jgi:choline dehydrogenase-like flavoprotein